MSYSVFQIKKKTNGAFLHKKSLTKTIKNIDVSMKFDSLFFAQINFQFLIDNPFIISFRAQLILKQNYVFKK